MHAWRSRSAGKNIERKIRGSSCPDCTTHTKLAVSSCSRVRKPHPGQPSASYGAYFSEQAGRRREDRDRHTVNSMKRKTLAFLTGAAWVCASSNPFSTTQAAEQNAGQSPPLRVLFLGDNGHHRPADRFKQLEPVLRRHRVELDYTESLDDLSPGKLAGYDCLLIYANWTKISPDQEKALLDFVEAGGGFVPASSRCWPASPSGWWSTSSTSGCGSRRGTSGRR